MSPYRDEDVDFSCRYRVCGYDISDDYRDGRPTLSFFGFSPFQGNRVNAGGYRV